MDILILSRNTLMSHSLFDDLPFTLNTLYLVTVHYKYNPTYFVIELTNQSYSYKLYYVFLFRILYQGGNLVSLDEYWKKFRLVIVSV